MTDRWSDGDKRILGEFARKEEEARVKAEQRRFQSEGIMARIVEENRAVEDVLGLDKKGFADAKNDPNYGAIYRLAMERGWTWERAKGSFYGDLDRRAERDDNFGQSVINSLKKQSRRRSEPGQRSGLTKTDQRRIDQFTDVNKGPKRRQPTREEISDRARTAARAFAEGLTEEEYRIKYGLYENYPHQNDVSGKNKK